MIQMANVLVVPFLGCSSYFILPLDPNYDVILSEIGCSGTCLDVCHWVDQDCAPLSIVMN